MESLNLENLSMHEPTTKASKSSKKRRWREIETIKERMRLKQELLSIDSTLEFEDEFDL